MTDLEDSRAIFAKLLKAFAPYANEIVLVGGWVHAIFLADANRRGLTSTARPVRTDDIDFTIPPQLLAAGRPTLIELAQQAGFKFDYSKWFDESKVPDLSHELVEGVIDLDFLTRAFDPNQEVPIEGQDGLIAHGYPDLHILTNHTQWLEAGPEIHASLSPVVRVRVPTPAAYVLQKGLASLRRTDREKVAKDLVYLYEIVRHPWLSEEVSSELPKLARLYPNEYKKWASYLGSLRSGVAPLSDVVDQLLENNRATGKIEEVTAKVLARIRRLLGDVEDHLKSNT